MLSHTYLKTVQTNPLITDMDTYMLIKESDLTVPAGQNQNINNFTSNEPLTKVSH